MASRRLRYGICGESDPKPVLKLPERRSSRVDVVDGEVHERAGTGVAGVLGEVQRDVAARQEQVERFHTGAMKEQRDADEPETPTEGEAVADAADASEAAPDEVAAEEAELDAYDLDEDGRVSLTENVRGELGMLDARAAEVAEEDGLKGKLGKAAHRLLDKLDND